MATTEAPTIEPSAKVSSSDGDSAKAEVELMRITLHKAQISTANMPDAEVLKTYAWLRAERKKTADDRNRAAAAERERIMLEQRTGNLRGRLKGQGVECDDWTLDQMQAKENELQDQADQRQREREAAAKVEAERREVEIRFGRAGCPQRHVEHLDKIDQQNPKWIEYRNLLVDRVTYANGFLVGLLGTRGTGKTELAVSVVHESCKRGFDCRYVKAMDLFRTLREAYTPVARGQAGVTESELLAAFLDPDLLVIDEVHQRGETQAENNALINLLDRRYDDRKCTILIANQGKEEFGAAIGESVVSRIHETGDALVCDWQTYRHPGSWLEGEERRVPRGSLSKRFVRPAE